jgi:hypothetical protein
MQKTIFSAFLVLSTFFSVAQTKIGLKFSPLLSVSRTDLRYENTANDTLDIDPSGLFGRISLGLVVDHSLSDTYYFSTGVSFLPKRVGVDIVGESGGFYANPSELYNLQYIQIPISLKLFTNEVLPDLSIFFQVGAGAEIKVFEEPVEDNYTLIRGFRPFDASVILGGGVEYRAGINTVLFADISYQRGLINIVKSTTPALPETFSIRTSAIMLDLGVKF